LFVVATFMSVLDTTIVNVALPTISADFHIAVAASGTVSLGYLVSLAVVMPATAAIGDRFGTKRAFVAALMIFTSGSVLCGLAGNLGELVACRVVQGVGGGMLLPLGTTVLFRAYSPEEQIRAARLLTIPTALAPALGPILGGAIVQDASWRLMFLLNLPVGIAALVGAARLPADRPAVRAQRFDVAGLLSASVGLGSLMYVIGRGSGVGWGTLQILTTSALGICFTAFFVHVERRRAMPLLRIDLLRDAALRGGMTTGLLGAAVFAGSLYLAPLLLQDGLGLSPLRSGLTTFPEALGVVIGAQVVSRAVPRVGARPLLLGGFLGLGVSCLLLAASAGTTDLWLVRVLLFALGVSAVNVHLPSQNVVFARTPRSQTGHASSLYNADRRFGAALGVAVFSSVIAARGAGEAVAPYRDGFFAAAAIAAVGLLAASRASRGLVASVHLEPEPVA
jgi:EmrB/QacA subfamily drug resistance transporter